MHICGKILGSFNFPQQLIDCIKNLYDIAYSRILVNEFLTDEIKINKSVRQGCPLSMALFVLYIEPLVRELYENISGFYVYDKFIKVIVYADDFNIVIRTDEEFDTMLTIFENFSKYAQIRINFMKSSYMRFNMAQTGPQLIKEVDHLKILGIEIHKSWYNTVNYNYNAIINNLKQTLQKHSVRNLNIYERCRILNIFILSKLWYLGQIFPPLNRHLGQIRAWCGKFIWHGHIYKVERNQLYLDFLKGGLGLVDPESKLKALFIKNVMYNLDNEGNYKQEQYLLDLKTPLRITKTQENGWYKRKS